MNKKKTKRKLILFVAFCFFVVLFIHFYVPRFISEINNPIIELLRNNKASFQSGFESNSSVGKFIEIHTEEKLKLSAYLTYSKLDITKGTVILLHGIRSQKEHFVELSNNLSQLGYNAVALDSRAHGQSEGTHCTFGVKEKIDVSRLIDYLNKEENIYENIGLWGQSLGGAIALQSMANDPRIKFGIVESTFSDFGTISNDYFDFHLGFSFKPLSSYLVNRAAQIADFDAADARPSKYCGELHQPILLVHGDQDQRIDIKYAKENFEKIASTQKEFITVEGAGHLNLWAIGKEVYFKQAYNFLNSNTAQPNKARN